MSNNNVDVTTNFGTGPSRCPIHDFETTDPAEWNKHCLEEGHTETGVATCIDCGTEIQFSHIPYQDDHGGRGKNITLRCENCLQKSDDLNRNIINQMKQQQQQQQQPVVVGGGSQQ